MNDQTENQGIVSVFLGVFPSREEFDAYLTETYDEEATGIGVNCPLWKDLGVRWLDHDFQDADYRGDVPLPVKEFLSKPFSFIDSFRRKLSDACAKLNIGKVNAGVFLYDFKYPTERPFSSPFLRFVGSFGYTASTPEWFKKLIEG